MGGMENLLYELVKQIKSEMYIGIIAPNSDEPNKKQTEDIHRPQKKGLIWFFVYGILKGNQILITESYDVIVAGSALVTPIVFILGFIHQKPVVVYAHGLDLIYRNRLYQLVIRFLLPRIDLVITNSSQTGDIARNLGV